MHHIDTMTQEVMRRSLCSVSVQTIKLFQQNGTTRIRPGPRMIHRCIRSFTSNTSAESPLIFRLRSDLKDAMRERNKNRYVLQSSRAFSYAKLFVAESTIATRLNVLRGLLGDIVSSSKIGRTVIDDNQVVAILKSRLRLSEKAAAEFAAAKRDDLKANEDAQVSVLQGYMDGLDKISEEDIKNAALEALDIVRNEGKKMHMGAIIKRLVGPGGPFHGKYLDMPSVTRIVREVIFTGGSEGTQNPRA